MRPLRIYLGDLTYTTLSLASEAFPLNIGFVAAYCQKVFGSAVELKLFKYIDQLETAIQEAPPDILGLSHYPWNRNLNLGLFKRLHTLSPKTIRLLGGPNIPLQTDGMVGFLEQRPLVDGHAIFEGEGAFADLVGKALDVGLERDRLFADPMNGWCLRSGKGGILTADHLPRRKDLNEIPSPYLTGLMDSFFDDKLSPLIETNRGCPFSCTFCHEGHDNLTKVHAFDLDRVLAELDYIADHANPGVINLMFADPNFGMYFQRDAAICDHIARLQRDRGWPRWIFASTGKNRPEKIGEVLGRLEKGTIRVWLSVQSMDQEVQKNIKRSNIKTEHMMTMGRHFEKIGIPTVSELILALPGDSVERHLKSMAALIEAGVEAIVPYTLMLLNGTELATDESRKQFGLQTRFRILPRDFGKLADGTVVAEIEEVVVGNDTMDFEDYCQLRRLHLMVNVVYNGAPFAPLFLFLRQKGISGFPLLHGMTSNVDQAPESVRGIFASFDRLTKEELWSDQEELLEFIHKPENYQKMIRGELGSNLIQTHVGLSHQVMDQWAGFLLENALNVLRDSGGDAGFAEQVEDLRQVCLGRVANLWGENWSTDHPEYMLRFDFAAWLAHGKEDLEAFRLPKPQRFSFRFPAQKQQERASYIKRFGLTPTGIGRVVVKLNNCWRDQGHVAI